MNQCSDSSGVSFFFGEVGLIGILVEVALRIFTVEVEPGNGDKLSVILMNLNMSWEVRMKTRFIRMVQT